MTTPAVSVTMQAALGCGCVSPWDSRDKLDASLSICISFGERMCSGRWEKACVAEGTI